MSLELQGQNRVPIPYHSGQKEFFFDSTAKGKVIAKGRRWGLTRGYAHRAIEYLMDGISPGLWVDTVNSNIDRYIERYFYPVLKHLPSNRWKWRQQRKELELYGHKLDMRSSDRPELIEGFAYKFIMLNEAGIILRKEYLWHNTIQPMMLDFNPDIYIGGTPKGKGLFHQLAAKAEDPLKKNWAFFRFTSFDNPYLTSKELHELVDDIPQIIQKQEVYAEFLEDMSAVFRNIKTCMTPPSKREEPQEGKKYYAGLDLARLVDFTVLTILNGDGNQVFFDRYNLLDWAVQKQRIMNTCKKYNAKLLLDSSGIGDPIFDDLKRMGLKAEGYKFTSESKKMLIESLMMAFEQKKIRILDDPTQKNELEIFEFRRNPSGIIHYSAPDGYHDDCVIALALANWRLQNKGVVPRIWRA